MTQGAIIAYRVLFVLQWRKWCCSFGVSFKKRKSEKDLRHPRARNESWTFNCNAPETFKPGTYMLSVWSGRFPNLSWEGFGHWGRARLASLCPSSLEVCAVSHAQEGWKNRTRLKGCQSSTSVGVKGDDGWI